MHQLKILLAEWKHQSHFGGKLSSLICTMQQPISLNDGGKYFSVVITFVLLIKQVTEHTENESIIFF